MGRAAAWRRVVPSHGVARARIRSAGFSGRHGRRSSFAPVSRSEDRQGAGAGVT
jgi:hypothetical protein